MSIEQKKALGEPDIMVQKFQEAISKSESFGKQLETFVQTLVLISDKVANAQTNHETLKQALTSVSDNSARALTTSQVHIDSLISGVDMLAKSKDSLEKEIGNIKSMFSPIGDKISQVEISIKNAPTMAHFIDLSSEIGKLKDMLALFNTQSLSAGSNLVESHNQLKNIVTAVTSDFINAKNKIEDLITHHEKSSGLVSVLQTKINDGIASTYKYVDDKVSSKIAAIPMPQSISLDDVKKEINDQFEPIRLDSSNAKLRSTNNETKITLLEKKIEQLQLMINKLQIGG